MPQVIQAIYQVNFEQKIQDLWLEPICSDMNQVIL